jgi:two-component system sensor kinase
MDGFTCGVQKEPQLFIREEDSFGSYLKIIGTKTQNMWQLIQDLLAFSRLGYQGMKTSDINMEEFARTVFDELKSISQERKLRLEIKNLPPAHGDPAMIRQVLTNLLSNAIKFTRPREIGVIEIGGGIREDQPTYYVKDNGIGFDMKFQDKLFGVFKRVHGDDEFDGTGVGLAMVQRIIHRHGGKVWAEGEINRGATFYFTLPSPK